MFAVFSPYHAEISEIILQADIDDQETVSVLSERPVEVGVHFYIIH